MMSRLKQLGKDGAIYGVGAVVAKSIGFFLLPIYTRIFSPAEYGTIELLVVITGFVSAVLGMGMDSSQSFFFFQKKAQGKAAQGELVSAILQWRLSWGVVVVVLATGFAPVLNQVFFRGELGWTVFAAAFAGALFQQVMSQSVEVFRLLYRPWPYVLLTLAQTAVAAVLILSFTLGLRQGILGYFLGTMLAAFFIACLGWYLIRQYIDFGKWHSAWWPRLLKFGLPLLPSGLAMYVMNTTDRWFIQQYHGPEALGVYAIGAKFALLMALVIETFRKAWWPMAMDAMHGGDGAETYRMIARLFMGVGVACVVYLAFLSPWLVQWLTAPEFHNAWPVVGVLAWQSLFYGFYLVASAGIWKAEKTWISIYLMGGAAIVSVCLNAIFVPRWGSFGAALSTSVTFFLWVAASMSISERLWKVRFPIKMLIFQILVGALTVGWMITDGRHTVTSMLVVHGVVLGLLASAVKRNQWRELVQQMIARRNVSRA